MLNEDCNNKHYLRFLSIVSALILSIHFPLPYNQRNSRIFGEAFSADFRPSSIMFITVRFGNDHKQIFNPDCMVINLLKEIKGKCRVGLSQEIDLTDETGLLIGISKARPEDRGLRLLVPHETYILVEKREAASANSSSTEDRLRVLRERLGKHDRSHRMARTLPKDHYFPLLLCVNKLYPDYVFHRSAEEKKTIIKRNQKEHKTVTPTRESSPGLSRKSIFSPTRFKQSAKRTMAVRRLTLIT